MTLEQLCEIMRALKPARAAQLHPLLTAAMREFEITTRDRQAAFIAQLAHESCEFRFFEELASGAAYEGRSDLGNNEPGDGERFKGRGPIQLTGRRNYAAAGAALKLDLVGHPEWAAQPSVGFRVAGWFWQSRGLNHIADGGPLTFDAITRRINGGLNGKKQRDAYFALARKVLGC